jgi:hypothetical protein
MKLSTAAAILAASASGSILKGAGARSTSTVSPLSGINLFPQANIDVEVEVDAAHANAVDGLGSLYVRRAYGKASLSSALLSQIEQALGPDVINAAALGEASQVQTLRLTKTSPWHTDCEMDGSQKRTPSKKDELQVGLFFSNTNEDAYFETQDGDLCIPVVEGNFVSFDGRMPHRTVVKSGHIDMVGPFSLSSSGFVNVAMDLGSSSTGYGSVGFLTENYQPQQQGTLVGVGMFRRQLSAVNGSAIEGDLVMGDMKDSEEYGDHFLALEATGLPSDCTNDCGIAIALSSSRECTEDVHDSALKVLLPKALFYSTDEGGSTDGWFEQFFDNVESANSPVSLSEVLSTNSTDSQLAPVVYLYDKEKVPVACAYLEPLSDEEKEELSMILNGDEEDSQIIEDEGSDATAAAGAVDVAGSGSVAVVPKLAVSMITACALALLSW